MKRGTTVKLIVILLLSLALWLSALNSFFDQGGYFFSGMCLVTKWMPW